jgi:hypothetical protein
VSPTGVDRSAAVETVRRYSCAPATVAQLRSRGSGYTTEAPSMGDCGAAVSDQSTVNPRTADHGPCAPDEVTAATRQV